MRPGDQILECNGVRFENIEFGDAVFHLKSSRQLNLLLKKGAGLELFPSESSGYDSSTGSSNGTEDLPPWKVGDRKEPTKNNKARHVLTYAQIETPSTTPTPPNTNEESYQEMEDMKTSGSHMSSRADMEIEEERKKLQEEQEKLRKDAEILMEEKRKFEEEKKSMSLGPISHTGLLKTQSTNSSSSNESIESNQSATSGSSGSLALALRNEIQRRAAKTEAGVPQVESPKVQVMKKEQLKNKLSNKNAPFIAVKNDRHDMLIAEFKKAHKKMFASSSESSSEEEEEMLKGSDSDFSPDSMNDLQLKDCKSPINERTMQKPKAPPPPPINKTVPNSSTMSKSPTQVMSTFKPNTPSTFSPLSPGIPTPDYDSTPDRSPLALRRQGKTAAKHVPPPSIPVPPPTMQQVMKAPNHATIHPKSPIMSTLRKTPPQSATKGKAPVPNIPQPPPCPSSLDLNNTIGKAISKDTNTIGQFSDSHSKSGNKQLLGKSSAAPPAPPYEENTKKSTKSRKAPSPTNSNNSRMPSSLGKQSNISEFSKRHPKVEEFIRKHPHVEAGSLDSFQIEDNQTMDHKPPPFYFEPIQKPNPLVSVQAYADKSEPTKFEFTRGPCDPNSKTMKFKQGEEAKIASKDYRAAHAMLGGAHLQSQIMEGKL